MSVGRLVRHVVAAVVTLTVVALALPRQVFAAAPTAPLVRIPFPHDDGTLTPYSFELGYPLMTLVYDTLLWRDADGTPQPWLARSVETSSDGRQLTIRLAEGVRWHDGMPLTAADVTFTFDFVGTHPHPRFTPQLRAVDSVVASDASTVVIRLRHPSPGFIDQPLADLPILPAHLWRGLPPARRFPEGLPVGSGPYRLVEHRPGEGYRFEANRDYFRGRPAVGTIEVPIIRRASETYNALLRNAVDALPASLPADEVDGFAGIATRVLRGPSYLGTVLMFNLRRPPFDRVEVRTAIAESLDLQAVAGAVGQSIPAVHGLVHPESPWSSSETLHVQDLEGARRTLAGLGLPAVEVLCADNDPVRLKAAQQVATALRRAGLEANAKQLPDEDLSRALGEDGGPASFGLAVGVISPVASYDPDFLATTLGSTAGDAVNVTGYHSPAFDRAAELVASTADPVARRAVMAEELKLLAAELPVVPLFFSTGAYAYRPAVYDGWVFVKGTGILDKRSFVEPSSPAPELHPTRTGDSTARFPLGWLAVGLLGLAAALALLALVRSR